MSLEDDDGRTMDADAVASPAAHIAVTETDGVRIDATANWFSLRDGVDAGTQITLPEIELPTTPRQDPRHIPSVPLRAPPPPLPTQAPASASPPPLPLQAFSIEEANDGQDSDSDFDFDLGFDLGFDSVAWMNSEGYIPLQPLVPPPPAPPLPDVVHLIPQMSLRQAAFHDALDAILASLQTLGDGDGDGDDEAAEKAKANATAGMTSGGTEEGEICAICFEEFDGDELLCRLTTCGHFFHPPCLQEWGRRQHTCPLCRSHFF